MENSSGSGHEITLIKCSSSDSLRQFIYIISLHCDDQMKKHWIKNAKRSQNVIENFPVPSESFDAFLRKFSETESEFVVAHGKKLAVEKINIYIKINRDLRSPASRSVLRCFFSLFIFSCNSSSVLFSASRSSQKAIT